MAQQHTSANSAEMHDTVETTALSDAPGTARTGDATAKVCCACGKNVTGQNRFKDAEGRYWCYDCGVEDHVRKHPEDGIACADCGGHFPPSKLTSFDDEIYCDPCLGKIKARKKREEARIAAASAEARAQEVRYKLFLAALMTGVVIAVALAAWVMTR